MKALIPCFDISAQSPLPPITSLRKTIQKVLLSMQPNRVWSLNKCLVLILVAGFVMLIFDVRAEHVDVVKDHWTAWIPIFYSGAMILIGALGLATYHTWGRTLLMVAFAAAFIVGGLGFYFHTQGHLMASIGSVLQAWRGIHPDDAPTAPPLAPLSFGGLGLIGVLACLPRFQAEIVSTPERVAH